MNSLQSRRLKIYKDILDISSEYTEYELDLAYKNAKNIFSRKNYLLSEMLSEIEIIELSKLASEAYEALRFKNKGHYIKSSFKKNIKLEHKIKNQKVFDGAFLKLVRNYKNITIEELSNFTKIKKEFLKAIEENNLSRLPSSKIYCKGFVYQYAKALNLDPYKVTSSYLQAFD